MNMMMAEGPSIQDWPLAYQNNVTEINMLTVGAVELQLAVRIYRMNATQGKIIEGMRQKFSGI